MSFSNALKKLKLPKFKDVLEVNTKARDEIKRVNINTIDVIYHTSNFKSSVKTVGKISRDTSLPIVYITVPENLAIFLLDESIEIDIGSGKTYIQVVENYPFSIVLNSELENNLKSKFYNDIISNKIGNINKKQFNKTGIGYLIPVLINKIPYNVIRINLNEKLNNSEDIDYLDLSQKALNELGNIKLLQSTNENKNDGLIIIGIIFGLLGMFLGSMITLYVIQ